jgi:hypothetical protein
MKSRSILRERLMLSSERWRSSRKKTMVRSGGRGAGGRRRRRAPPGGARRAVALAPGDDVLEEGDGDGSAVHAQLEVLLLQPVDEAAVLVEDRDARLHDLRVDSQDLVLRLGFARVLPGERGAAGGAEGEHRRAKDDGGFIRWAHIFLPGSLRLWAAGRARL